MWNESTNHKTHNSFESETCLLVVCLANADLTNKHLKFFCLQQSIVFQECLETGRIQKKGSSSQSAQRAPSVGLPFALSVLALLKINVKRRKTEMFLSKPTCMNSENY